MYLAVDDTDSIQGMCTTYLVTELLRSLPDLDLIGLPRLVRLNPAVPWKTRGNGAICLRIGRGGGEASTVGEIDGKPIESHSRCREEVDQDRVLDTACEVISEWSRIEEGASPGVAAAPKKPRQRLYWRAVRGMVGREETIHELERVDAVWNGLEGSRGVIGAASAMSWRPRDRTYEVIAYREQKRWGQAREVTRESVKRMDRRYESTFNNYDWEEDTVVITPNSPCPVLYGIRGDSWEDLLEAKTVVESEAIPRWVLFLTNQGTDDHLIGGGELLPNRSYVRKGEVTSSPENLPGGHVVFSVITSKGEGVECTAYEPSKGFREVIRALHPGDKVRVVGELREEPRTLNLEKIELIELVEVWEKKGNPVCPSCGRRMKSVGAGQGFRCRDCSTRTGEGAVERERATRRFEPGWYEPPVSARRHLSRPLKRMH